jgi:hypothetical protein
MLTRVRGTTTMNGCWADIIAANETKIVASELRVFQENIGYQLPEDYVEFLLNFNGGRVTREHEIFVTKISCHVGVDYFYPLSAPSPFLGIMEARDLQMRNRMAIRQALEVAHDMGTGHYYLMLDGEQKGAVFFVWTDDRVMLSAEEWESWEVLIPPEMIRIAASFDELVQMIIDNET